MIKNIDVIFRKPYNYCNLRKIIYHQYLPMLIGIFDQMGAQSDRLRCEVCQNLFLRPMNTGFLRHAVATALTVYGIETWFSDFNSQHFKCVATALTVYGIETLICKLHLVRMVYCCNSSYRLRYWNWNNGILNYSRPFTLQQLLPFTVLKPPISAGIATEKFLVATALTVYGIETCRYPSFCFMEEL